MLVKLVSVAVLAVVSSFGVAKAQSAGDFGGPRELPPASFTGQQYVDSQGCVFLRAGLGGQTNWVPRVSRSRTQLCGYPPTFGNNQVAIVDPEPPVAAPAAVAETARPSSAPEPTVLGPKPIDTVASLTTPPRLRAVPAQRRLAPETYVPAPVVLAAPPSAPQPAQRVTSAPGGTGKIGCFTDAPVAERFALRNGGSVVLCTRGDGDLSHARAPLVPGGAAAVAPSGYLEGPDPAADVQPVRTAGAKTAPVSATQPPKGYKLAFEDDRLNPRRAKGTAQGQADQDRVWTRDIPAQLVADAAPKAGTKLVRREVTLSTRSEPAATGKPAAKGGSFVQIGTFGQPANAEGASARLAQIGLPVARSRITKNGKALQIVMAGPFGSRQEAQAALSRLRGAGFSDAFIR